MAVGEVLDLRIERQANIPAILRQTDRTDIFDDLATPVLDHAAATRMPEQLTLEGEFDTFQSFIVDPGKADHMRGHFPGRIITAVFFVEPDPRQLQCGHTFTDFRGQLPL